MAPKINESKTAKQRSDDLKKNMSDSPNRSGDQKHLSYVQKTNLGSFYTPPEIVAMVGELIDKHIPNDSREWTVLDSSRGYGAFLDLKLRRRRTAFSGGPVGPGARFNPCRQDARLIVHKNNIGVFGVAPCLPDRLVRNNGHDVLALSSIIAESWRRGWMGMIEVN